MERLLWKVAWLLMDYLDGGLSAFEFGSWPGWPKGEPNRAHGRWQWLDSRALGKLALYSGQHKVSWRARENNETHRRKRELARNGMGLFTYSAYSVKDILLRPDYIPGQFSEHWHDILEEMVSQTPGPAAREASENLIE
jgi:hypothetical protein